MSEQASPQDDDLRALLARRQQSRPTRTTWILLALIAIALGFAAGACTQRAVSSATGAAGDPSAPPVIAPTTIGTVTAVESGSMVLTTSSGETVTVVVPDGVPVTTAVEVPLGELPIGATVVVRGPVDAAGVITAESVAEQVPRPAPEP